MTRPRRILAGDVVLGTRRCIERRFLLRPDPVTCQIFRYCLARAARITGVLLHEFVVLSNHYHVVLTDPRGNRPEFFRELNQLVARAVNANFGRWETFFAPGSYNAPLLADGAAILDKSVYVLCNVVEAGLVKLPQYWDGVSSWGMEYGQARLVKRPDVFFRDSMPEEESLTLVRPAALHPELSDKEARAYVRTVAQERSHASAQKLHERGGGFMGMRRVCKQPRESSPDTRPPRRGIRPTVAGKSKWARIEALQDQTRFIESHREARLRFEAGEFGICFPRGTYWMVRRYCVAVAKN